MTYSNPVSSPTKSNWSDQKNKLKAKYPVLTDADVHYEEGKKDEMFTKLQTKLGKTKDELKAIITAL